MTELANLPDPSRDDALRLLAINDRLDDDLEACRREHLSLADTLAKALPSACELLRAEGALVRALDETLSWSTFRHGRFEAAWEAGLPEGPLADPAPGDARDRLTPVEGAVIAERVLECAGQAVGWLAVALPPEAAPRWEKNLRRELRAAAEQLDDFLEHIAGAARKHALAVAASQALRSSVLEEGCDAALKVLADELDLDGALLVYGDLDHRRRTLHYRRYERGCVTADSFEARDPAIDAMLAQGSALLDPEDSSLHPLLGHAGAVETQLVNGLTAAPIGKLLVTGGAHGLGPEGHDILHLFAECLSQRLVDYNRERRTLAAAFSPDDTSRLLRVKNKYQRYLAPREEPIAMLFCDVVSFTAMCERVLQSATEIGAFVDRWSEGAVDLLFEHHGVFDKMVGDCVIGLFGPPFFESSAEKRALDATRAALAIAEFTAALGDELGFSERIREAGTGQGLGVAIGINLGRASVGFFGPHNDYTGFSQEMNNAARLQGVAGFQEVLVSKSMADLLRSAADLTLSEAREATVKNVKDPLVYHAVARA